METCPSEAVVDGCNAVGPAEAEDAPPALEDLARGFARVEWRGAAGAGGGSDDEDSDDERRRRRCGAGVRPEQVTRCLGVGVGEDRVKGRRRVGDRNTEGERQAEGERGGEGRNGEGQGSRNGGGEGGGERMNREGDGNVGWRWGFEGVGERQEYPFRDSLL